MRWYPARRGKLASTVYQLGAQATMLGVVDASVLQLFHATINVHLANHRFSRLEWEGEGVSLFRCLRCCRFVLFVQLGYRIGVRQRKTQETRDLPL